MDQILASAAAAGMTISPQDLAQIQQAMSVNHNPSDGGSITIGGEEAPGLRFSSIKEGVREEMSAAAHSFASTRLLPEIWRWAALCKLRNDITQLYETKKQEEENEGDQKSENTNSGKYTYLQVTDQEIVGNCIPYTVVLKKTPDSVKILNIVCVIPCVEFNTHAVVTVDTEVIYNVTGKLLKTAEKIVLKAKKQQNNSNKNENTASKNGNNDDDDEASTSFVVIPPSSIIDENNNHKNNSNTSMMIVPTNSANCKSNKTKDNSSSSSSSSCYYTMKARIVWRTLHFVRKDGVFKGSFEIQSTACRAFSCECTETGNTFVWCGMKGSLQNKSFSLLLSSGKFHEMWWRGFLECYTRPTIHLVFAWLLWQNNSDLRKFVEKKQNNKNNVTKKSMTKTQKKRLEQLKQESKIVEYPTIAKRRQRNEERNNNNSSTESEDDDEEISNSDDDDENEEKTNTFIEVEDFLEELKTKIHLTLFDHNPTFAVFGMGMNVITNYLSVLFPWTDCHVAELEPSVYAANVLSEDFAERSIDLLPSKKESLLQKQFELRQDSRNSLKMVSTTTNKRSEKVVLDEGGRQIAHIGDVVKLLGVDLASSPETKQNHLQEEKEEVKSSKNISTPQIPDDGGLSIIFLDCFDPVAVNMDHSFKVLQACHRRLRRGGLLAVNTHLATTSSGQELHPFVEVFGGDEAVQVITIAGYQQILILCQKNRSNNSSNNKKSATKKIIPPQNVREYRAICRVANACPVFVQVGEGVLRNIEKISFFGNVCDEVQEQRQQKQQQEKQTILKTPSKKKSNHNNDDQDDDEENANEFILRPDSAPSTQFENIIAPIISNISSRQKVTTTTTKSTGKNNRTSSASSSSTSKNTSKPKIHRQASVTKQLLDSSRPPSIAAYPNLFCAAKGRIHESCSCLLCAGKWLDPTIFTESRRIHVKKNINNNNKDAKSENEDSSVVVGRWMTKVLEFNEK